MASMNAQGTKISGRDGCEGCKPAREVIQDACTMAHTPMTNKVKRTLRPKFSDLRSQKPTRDKGSAWRRTALSTWALEPSWHTQQARARMVPTRQLKWVTCLLCAPCCSCFHALAAPNRHHETRA